MESYRLRRTPQQQTAGWAYHSLSLPLTSLYKMRHHRTSTLTTRVYTLRILGLSTSDQHP